MVVPSATPSWSYHGTLHEGTVGPFVELFCGDSVASDEMKDAEVPIGSRNPKPVLTSL